MGEVGKGYRGKEGRPVFVLSQDRRKEKRMAESRKRKTRISLLSKKKRGGQNGSTLIPTTDLGNYYRLWLNEMLRVIMVSELDP